MAAAGAAATSSHAPQIRSLYRAILRELPAHRRASEPSPIQRRVRAQLAAAPAPPDAPAQLQQAAQHVAYLRAQRTYATLLERYNPGMDMGEEERVRRTVARVGMAMPEEWKAEKNRDDDGGDK